MPATLADSLDLALPYLPGALVPPSAHPDLRDLARRLAPVHRCGFEVRLASGSDVVDLQQGITVRDGEPERLRAHLAGSNGAGPASRALDDFVGRWADGSSALHRGVEDVWLEFDRPPLASLSVFAGLRREPDPSYDRQAVAREALDLLLGSASWSRWRPAVERCFEACADGARVGHLGAMLGRSAPALRVTVKRLEPEHLAGYLPAVGWPGPVAEPEELVRRLRPLVDGIALCMDVGERVHGRLGFECHLRRQPPAEPRWTDLLDEMVAAGWCAPEKRDALLAWPGRIRPTDAATGWPPDLVRASLGQPPDRFTSLERGLTHVKIAYEPGRPVEAKAYFGFQHGWLRAA